MSDPYKRQPWEETWTPYVGFGQGDPLELIVDGRSVGVVGVDGPRAALAFAAPDLYRALALIVSSCSIDIDMLVTARKALAKARGE